MKKSLIVCVLLVGFWSASLVIGGKEGGSEAGNGGDLFREEADAAWFLNDHVIRFCIRSKGFSLEQSVLRKKIEWAYGKWEKYYREKHASQGLNAASGRHVDVSFRVKYDERCSGATDVVFYFGESDREVELAKASYAEPLGFAHRVSFDLIEGKSHGFVWISSEKADWKKPGNLEAILLHEIGHTSGVPHVAGTIMDEKIAYLIIDNKLNDEAMEIDHWTELVLRGGRSNYRGVVSSSRKMSRENFRILTGREAVGETRAYADIFLGVPDHPWTITLEDDLSRHPLKVRLFHKTASYSNVASYAFKVAYLNEGKIQIRKIPVLSGTLMGEVEANGKAYVFVCEYNMYSEGERTPEDYFVTDSKLKYVPFRMFFVHASEKRSFFGPSGYWYYR